MAQKWRVETSLKGSTILEAETTVYGFYGRILRIDLSEKNYEIKDVRTNGSI